jgi:hypothetical protein
MYEEVTILVGYVLGKQNEWIQFKKENPRADNTNRVATDYRRS